MEMRRRIFSNFDVLFQEWEVDFRFKFGTNEKKGEIKQNKTKKQDLSALLTAEHIRNP